MSMQQNLIKYDSETGKLTVEEGWDVQPDFDLKSLVQEIANEVAEQVVGDVPPVESMDNEGLTFTPKLMAEVNCTLASLTEYATKETFLYPLMKTTDDRIVTQKEDGALKEIGGGGVREYIVNLSCTAGMCTVNTIKDDFGDIETIYSTTGLYVIVSNNGSTNFPLDKTEVYTSPTENRDRKIIINMFSGLIKLYNVYEGSPVDELPFLSVRIIVHP